MKNKCNHTYSGKHHFRDTSYEVCWSELLYLKGEKRPYGSKSHCTKVKGEWVCKYCGIVDDTRL